MPLVIAHRGASFDHTENTIAAFEGAQEHAADWVELDVRRTADGVLIVHHDAHLGDGRVIVDCQADDLPNHVPSIVEALEACGDLGVNIEIKNLPQDPDYDSEHSVAEAVAGVARAYLSLDQVLVSSFNMDDIDRLRQIDPEIPTGFLVFDIGDRRQLIDWVAERGHRAIHPHVAFVDAALTRAASEAGLAVNVWTVDEPDRIAALVELGVDGIITNDPKLARSVLDQR
ncbi:MAG: glycerophosphodiester phosphodiesterase [Acidobacteria bacterium]|nr:glycerophosphodiester phosphodiesterase [Acidobacteriota bacterium]